MVVGAKRGRRITSVRGFVDSAFKQSSDPSFFYAYRGHASESYKIRPSILRTLKRRQNERRILQELLSSASHDFLEDDSTFDRLVRAQHYGLPTRLLDVTLNPLVALYFATEEVTEIDSSHTGEVLVFKIPWRAVKYSDSDSVSCLSNLAYMTHKERARLRRYKELDLELFNKDPVVDRLVQFVKAEKSGFRNIVKPGQFQKVYFVNPRENNARLVAQSGRFLIYGERPNYDDVIREFSITTMKIDAISKENIRKQLDQLSINGRTLFPEVESAAKYIVARFL